ncbi:MAG: hypothetical protein JXR94_02190 [Candidatus Hydrogenedentes bacterium]|nr:hypothetical protein [Candidatus Hydrogenedentota bacterium]
MSASRLPTCLVIIAFCGMPLWASAQEMPAKQIRIEMRICKTQEPLPVIKTHGDSFRLDMSQPDMKRLIESFPEDDVMACPFVITTLGKECRVTMGHQIPAPKFEPAGEGPDGETLYRCTVYHEDVGLFVNVLPTADESEERVNLHLKLDISAVVAYAQLNGIEAQVPAIERLEREDKVPMQNDRWYCLCYGGFQDGSLLLFVQWTGV